MSDVSTVLEGLIAVVKTNELKALQTPLADFFTSITATPTLLNIAAQVALFNAKFVAAQSGIEQSVLTAMANVVNTHVQAALASPTPANPL